MSYDPTLSQKGELAYDVRQALAQIIGEIMMQITAARLERRYMDWMNFIDNFHTEISMKLNDKEETEYKELLKSTLDHVNKFKAVYSGDSVIPEHHSEVYSKIKELEIWLKKKADKHDIFGSKRANEGLS